ncbi:hypothetical protein MNBD_NITROSPINAE04-2505 [hydrothermal vent metagenome]|uniref:Spore protein YkvP/CgeB glycosyl transferase-like domain-containing protein n=1 Tax=hydrothermal vent metagenome TaxID=652676 RepID=A0A3B1CJB8_9ZZZZ
MRILSFNWHTPYLSMLAMLDHTFEIAPPNIETDLLGSWNEEMRPVPKNVTPISRAQMQDRIRNPGYYDLIIGHNVKDIVMSKKIKTPKVLVFHNKLSAEAALGNQPGIIDEYRKFVRELVSGVYCVFISESKKSDWGLPGAIIMPGIDASLYGGYTGQIRRALRVGNSIKVRDLMTGYSLQEEVLEGLPNILIGENPDIPDCEVSKGWGDLKKAYRENRLFINTTLHPWEDGYNLGLLEATATGMPVVSVSNPTCPITDGVDGYVCDGAKEMREKVIKLIDNQNLAKEIGGRGREMARRIFPMETFLAKWDFAINKAVEVFSTGLSPSTIFQPSQGRPKRSFDKKMRAGRKNVILSYTSYPATAASYMEKALRKNHNVITAGCKITPEIIKAWSLANLEQAKTHDIHTPDLTVEADFMLERIPAGFAPDFFLWVETGLGKAPNGLGKIDCPTAAYLIDTHMHLERDLEAAARFDLVFLAQRAYIPKFKERGIENIHWLPLACDPEIHGKTDVKKSHDVGFVGSLTDDRRVELMQKLAEKMEVRYEREFLKKMTEFLCKSRIVFNNAIRDDLNMRVFEVLCSGSLLMTDFADGIDEFFEDGKHLVIYNDENIVERALYYLKHLDEAETIARQGRELALEKHTYERRVDEVVKTMEKLTGLEARRRE